MKVAFGPALPVGTAGDAEYFDVWLTSFVPVAGVLERLAGATPVDLAPTAVRYVAESEPSLSAAISIARYRVAVTSPAMGPEQLEEALRGVIETGELAVEHKGKVKVFELARSLPKEPRVSSADGLLVVDATTRIGQEGSLRPEALIHEALTCSGLPGSISAVTRAGLFIEAGSEWVEPLE